MGESFRNLAVWQRSIELTLAVYKLTSSFPDSERYGLTNQLRRASVSVASKIAEGYGRSTKGEYLQFLGHAADPIPKWKRKLSFQRRSASARSNCSNQQKNCAVRWAVCWAD